MKLDLGLSTVPRVLRRLLSELRDKRLWPVAALLLAAIVAAPLLLSKSSPATPVAQAPVASPPPSSATSLPAISVQSTPAHSRLAGRGHDPFATQSAGSGPSTTTASSAASAVSTVGAAASNALSALSGGAGVSTPTSSSSASSSGSSTTSSSTSSSSTPPSITPNAKPKPAPSGLSSTQSYDVALAITNSSGGIDTIDPLERLSVLPNDQQPLLVEMGVLRGGKRVLFEVQPGTIVSGPGTCTPGPIDCEILSLGQDQTEAVSTRSGSIVNQVALFAITGITAADHGSAAAANRARQTVSAAGRTLLDQSRLPTISLFQYDPSVGAVVDLRNLTVGGS